MTEEGKAITRRDFMRGVASATAATALGLPIIGCREAS
ncbi:MAG: twin-arginine translocation signal domain-containing protein, partial [Anaerolineae bacterium]|nr:twin-arginine translocation signal domain-containing protein [Anaerolineae bacterium]